LHFGGEVADCKQCPIDLIWKRFGEERGVEDRDALILNYLHLVKFAVGKIGSSLPSHIKMEDLYSSGITGLIKAVERFDPTKNSKFESYAVLLIKGAIIDELRELDWVPRSVHQKAHWIADAQAHLQQTLGRDPTDPELANYLGITQADLEELLQRVRPAILISLNGEIFSQDSENCSFLERIADAKAETSYEIVNKKEHVAILEKAIGKLSEQEKRVLRLYYYDDLMLREIGTLLGVSESRVSQIHTKALLKLRRELCNLD
jgi:RNA polymerase sigma factor FliA